MGGGNNFLAPFCSVCDSLLQAQPLLLIVTASQYITPANEPYC